MVIYKPESGNSIKNYFSAWYFVRKEVISKLAVNWTKLAKPLTYIMVRLRFRGTCGKVCKMDMLWYYGMPGTERYRLCTEQFLFFLSTCFRLLWDSVCTGKPTLGTSEQTVIVLV